MEVVEVKHRKDGKINYYNPCGKVYSQNDTVIIEIDKYRDYGKVLRANHDVNDSKINFKTFKRIIRVANPFDFKKIKENTFREQKAYTLCKEYIKKHKLSMHLIAVEYTFDRKKLKFYFTSNQKVDFRSLVKELIEEFKTGVELRQIGVRDAAKILGGLGVCGRKVCCASHLHKFDAINLKIARAQNILSSPDKISGVCGRLRCCLRYECDNYTISSDDLQAPEDDS